MRGQERAALAAIIASGLVTRSQCLPEYPNVQQAVAKQALAIADMILNQTDADEKAAYQREQRK